MTDPRAIAAGLSEAQRRALFRFETDEKTLSHGLAVASLIRNGLLDYGPLWGLFGRPKLRITRLGRRVRQCLMEEGR